MAVGAREYRGPEYGYGTDARIMTQQEFEGLLAGGPCRSAKLKSVVMIQCVGSGRNQLHPDLLQVALKNALKLKQIQSLGADHGPISGHSGLWLQGAAVYRSAPPGGRFRPL